MTPDKRAVDAAENNKGERMENNIYPITIHEAEREIIIARDDASFLIHLKTNDPTLAGYVQLSDFDAERVRKAFAEPDASDFISISGAWEAYAEQLGLAQ